MSGLRARGGYEVDIAWADGRPTRAEVRANRDARCVVRAAGTVRVTSGGKNVRVTPLADHRVAFEAAAGGRYALAFSAARP